MAAALAGGCRTREGGQPANGSVRTTPEGARTSAGCIAPPKGEWTAAAMGTATFDVNRATRGMAARVRWIISPDSGSILVVEDPVGVENEPIPDGVLFASERTGRTWRMDSVWSVAPSPDWTRVAFGRAAVLRGGEAQRIDPRRWDDAARSLAAIAGAQPALTADSLRAHAFPVSGMSVAEGAAATFVADVAGDVALAPMHFVSLDGWRVRWSCDGADVLVGNATKRAQDDGPSGAERRVAARTGAATGSAAPVDAQWVLGTVLDISVPVPDSAKRLTLRSRIVEGRAGRVVVLDGGEAKPTDVGPGIPLAATRGGHFIVAVAPRAVRRMGESPDHVVVYRVP